MIRGVSFPYDDHSTRCRVPGHRGHLALPQCAPFAGPYGTIPRRRSTRQRGPIMNHRQEAVHLATHYFRLIAERAGVKWESDNDIEIEALIDAIIAAARGGDR